MKNQPEHNLGSHVDFDINASNMWSTRNIRSYAWPLSVLHDDLWVEMIRITLGVFTAGRLMNPLTVACVSFRAVARRSPE